MDAKRGAEGAPNVPDKEKEGAHGGAGSPVKAKRQRAAVLTGKVPISQDRTYRGASPNERTRRFPVTPETIQPIQEVLNRWILAGQALVGSVGALAFVFAFLWKMTAVEPRTVLQAKQWIQRIVVGTIGVEMAGTLVHVLTGSIPGH